jgi:hypothetical protein
MEVVDQLQVQEAQVVLAEERLLEVLQAVLELVVKEILEDLQVLILQVLEIEVVGVEEQMLQEDQLLQLLRVERVHLLQLQEVQ